MNNQTTHGGAVREGATGQKKSTIAQKQLQRKQEADCVPLTHGSRLQVKKIEL